jgi:tetratricopeptide (TPR) repeat protein
VRDPKTHAWMKWRYEMHFYVSLGELALARGDLAMAEENAARCLEIATRTNSRKYLVRAWRLQGEIAQARRDWAAAEAHLRRASATGEVIRNPPQLWKSHAALGRLYLARKQNEAAGHAYAAAQRVLNQTIAGLQHPGLRAGLEHSPLTREIRSFAGPLTG